MSVEKRVSGDKKVTVEISYCPSMGIYHYRRTGVAGAEDEYFFDNPKLEQTLSVYLKDGKVKDAEFMARLTTAARETPHKILVFGAEGTCEVREPVLPEWVAELAVEKG